MNNTIKRTWNQNSMVIIEDLQGMAFQAESGGHTFQISGIDSEGNAVALSGTPAGVMLRSDGQDVTLTCSVSGGVVSATLPANAYSVPGRFCLTIFLTSDGQKTAIYAAVGTVGKTSSGTVAPPAGSDVVDLVNAIATAVATIPASYTDLMAAVAPTYSSSGLYAVGSYAWYNGKLYRCTTAITSGETWTSGHWTLANLGSDLVDLKSALSFEHDSVEQLISQNFVNSSLIRDGYYVNNNNGTIIEYANSDYFRLKVPVKANKKYTVASGFQSGVSYLTTADGSIIQNLSSMIEALAINSTVIITIPNNNTAEYIYISYYKPYNIGTVTNAFAYEGEIRDKTLAELSRETNQFVYFVPKNEELKAVEGSLYLNNIITNDMVQAGKYCWCSVGNNVAYQSNADYTAVTIPVEPNTTYSINHAFEQVGFGGFVGSDGKVIIASLNGYNKNVFTTPANAYAIACSWYKHASLVDDLVFIKGDYPAVVNVSASNFPRNTNVLAFYNKFEIDERLGGKIYVNKIYVSTTGNDSTGDGTEANPYASILKANSVITDNSYYNRYEILVADGTYTDLQTLYAGIDGTDYQGVMAKSYVTYKSQSGNPNNCILSWDGSTGYTGAITDANVVWKCFFHINNNTLETVISGFKFVGANLRYCLHLENNYNSTPTVENCIFDWSGSEDIWNRPVVGMGGTLFNHITFKECKFYNSQNTAGMQWHDNAYPYTYTFEKGCKIEFIDCWFDGLNIQVRSQNYTRNMPFELKLVRCGGLNIVYPSIISGGTKNYWRLTKESCFIADDLLSDATDETTYEEQTERK